MAIPGGTKRRGPSTGTGLGVLDQIGSVKNVTPPILHDEGRVPYPSDRWRHVGQRWRAAGTPSFGTRSGAPITRSKVCSEAPQHKRQSHIEAALIQIAYRIGKFAALVQLSFSATGIVCAAVSRLSPYRNQKTQRGLSQSHSACTVPPGMKTQYPTERVQNTCRRD